MKPSPTFFLDGAFAASGRVGGLASGASSLLTVSVPATEGSHTVLVLIDSEGSQPESNEENNELGASFGPLSLSMSDLAISSLTITPESASAEDAVLALITITNAGEAPTLADFDLLLTLDGVQVALVICQSLEPGSSRTVEAWFTAAAGEGTHVVQAAVDSLSLITEADETNNTRAASLTLSGTTEPPSPEGISITLESDKTAYAYDEVITLAGSVIGPAGALSGLLVTVSLGYGEAVLTRFAVTGEDGGYALSISVLDLLEELVLSGAVSGLPGEVAVAASAGTTAVAAGSFSVIPPDPAVGVLALVPGTLQVGVHPGDFRAITLKIANIGNETLTLSAVRGLTLLPWMSVAVGEKLEIAPGEMISVNLYLAPPSDMTLPRVFSGSISIEGTYGPREDQKTVTEELPFTVELSNLDLACIEFTVKGIAGLPLAGAVLTLLDLASGACYRKNTGTEGTVSFADMVPGLFLYLAEADGYQHALGTVESGNLQAGMKIGLSLAPEGEAVAESLVPSLTVTPGAATAYRGEPVLVTVRLVSGLFALEDLSLYLRLEDATGADATGLFDMFALGTAAAVLNQRDDTALRFLLVPGGSAEGGYTITALVNFSTGAMRKSLSVVSGLEVRGPPELAISYFIPSDVRIGRNYRAGFELSNLGSAIEDLRLDYLYLPLRLASWRIPASYLIYSGSIPLFEGSLSGSLGTLEGDGTTRGYLNMASSFDSSVSYASACLSYLSGLGIYLPLSTTTMDTDFIFRDRVHLDESPKEDATLVSTEAGTLPSYIYSWTDGEKIPVAIVQPEIISRPDFNDPTLALSIPEKEGYTIIALLDEWRGYNMDGAERGDGKTINELNYWRDNGIVFLLDDPEHDYKIFFSRDYRVDLAGTVTMRAFQVSPALRIIPGLL